MRVFSAAKNDVQWWTVLSDSGKWGQVPAKYLKEVSVSEGNVTVHTPSESPDIVIRFGFMSSFMSLKQFYIRLCPYLGIT